MQLQFTIIFESQFCSYKRNHFFTLLKGSKWGFAQQCHRRTILGFPKEPYLKELFVKNIFKI